ncbi:MAG: GTP-dependent dephospho-CoA kinase family protein [archaeon]|nr:GTP-dependent dephospho-CoA kinase family protein [archaeon]
MFVLKEDLIHKFKEPLGELFPDFNDALPAIKEAKFLISVGDQTAKNLVDNDIIPDLGIIDGRIQRKDHNHTIITAENILDAENPAGTITKDLWETIEFAINTTLNDKEKRFIVVKGEEDLAVLPCILLAPAETVILYGQPNEGLVFVNVSDVINKAKELMSYFHQE